MAGGRGCLVFQKPCLPVASNSLAETAEARQTREKQWLESEAGKAAERAGQNHSFQLAADGSFNVEGVAPGVYELLAVVYDRFNAEEAGMELGWWFDEISVPAAEPLHDKPLDLGTLVLHPSRLFPGDQASDFAFTSPDGRTHRLSEFRGRSVMLQFTSKWFDLACTDPEHQTAMFLHHAGRAPLVWINLSNDSKRPPVVTMAADDAIQYLQGTLDASSDVFDAYDVWGPSRSAEVLIAEDGRVVRK